MRGQHTLFEEMFGKEAEEAVKLNDKQRPRNVLMPERNMLLLYRFYFLIEINRMRYDDALKQLEKEFFIVEARIVVVLSDNDDQLRKIVKEEKPDRSGLEKVYPHINWKYSPR
jgi:hypothetical protein